MIALRPTAKRRRTRNAIIEREIIVVVVIGRMLLKR
jgi:hypothetical protein